MTIAPGPFHELQKRPTRDATHRESEHRVHARDLGPPESVRSRPPAADHSPATAPLSDFTRGKESIVIGGGPAGLTAARELEILGRTAVVLEASDSVGGISRTARAGDYRFDLGGHRFFTKSDTVNRVWTEIMGEDMLERDRMSRILYGGKFFDYPLRPMNALRSLGLFESARVMASYARAQVRRKGDETTFEEWVTNRFGKRLYEIFFKTYTEKVWGMSCDEIGADWAAQRIKNLDLWQAAKSAVFSSNKADGEVITTLIDRFRYPRFGPGQMWERCRDQLAERGVPTVLNTPVTRIHHANGSVTAVEVQHAGRTERVDGDQFFSSMPLRTLIQNMTPAPPAPVLEAANRLKYRDFLTVALVVDEPDLFPDNWVYVHEPGVRLGRIQNFKNWSPDMVPVESHTTLGLEYFVNVGDDLWNMDDEKLGELGREEMGKLGLIDPDKVLESHVVRVPKAYPVYDPGYAEVLDVLREYVESFDNLHCIGRNGQHRYNNQDHSMLTGIFAARNVAGASYDIWSVNAEDEYHEQGEAKSGKESSSGDRAVPMAG